LAGVNHLGLLTARSARRCVSALLDAPAANVTQVWMHGAPSTALAAA